MPASSAASAEFDLNDPAMAMFSSVFAKFQGDADQEMSDEVVGAMLVRLDRLQTLIRIRWLWL
jgi:hypothetical protein